MISTDSTPPEETPQQLLERRQVERRAKARRAADARWKGTTPEERRAFAKRVSAARWGDAAERAGRRERIIVSVSIPKAVYDRYCRCALRARPQLKVRHIMRHILTIHAPSP